MPLSSVFQQGHLLCFKPLFIHRVLAEHKCCFPETYQGDTKCSNRDATLWQLGVQCLAQGHLNGCCWEMNECWIFTSPSLMSSVGAGVCADSLSVPSPPIWLSCCLQIFVALYLKCHFLHKNKAVSDAAFISFFLCWHQHLDRYERQKAAFHLLSVICSILPWVESNKRTFYAAKSKIA